MHIRDSLLEDMYLERRLRRPRQRYRRNTRNTKLEAVANRSRRSCALQWAADPRSSLVTHPAVLLVLFLTRRH